MPGRVPPAQEAYCRGAAKEPQDPVDARICEKPRSGRGRPGSAAILSPAPGPGRELVGAIGRAARGGRARGLVVVPAEVLEERRRTCCVQFMAARWAASMPKCGWSGQKPAWRPRRAPRASGADGREREAEPGDRPRSGLRRVVSRAMARPVPDMILVSLDGSAGCCRRAAAARLWTRRFAPCSRRPAAPGSAGRYPALVTPSHPGWGSRARVRRLPGGLPRPGERCGEWACPPRRRGDRGAGRDRAAGAAPPAAHSRRRTIP